MVDLYRPIVELYDHFSPAVSCTVSMIKIFADAQKHIKISKKNVSAKTGNLCGGRTIGRQCIWIFRLLRGINTFYNERRCKDMKRKNVDTMQEIRLRVGQIVVPGLITVGAVMQIPGVKEGVDEKIQQTKESIARKFRKESR